MVETLKKEVGAVLRRARRSRRLTLDEAARFDAGASSASTLGAYERGEREISVDRFFRLSFLYNVSPVRLLADVLRRVEGRPSIRLDVRKVKSLPGAEAGILDGFIRNVFILRNEPVVNVISLREGDFDVLATATGRRTPEFVNAISPAFVGGDGPSREAADEQS